MNNRFYKQNNNFARAPRFFVHFFTRFCTTTTWKCLISRFVGDVTSDEEIQFLFLYLDMVPRNSTPGGFANIWQRKWVEIIAIKTERTQIHVLSDILITVASLDLKVANDKHYGIKTHENPVKFFMVNSHVFHRFFGRFWWRIFMGFSRKNTMNMA